MATLPAYNPVTPHLALIPGGLRHGLMIRIKGQMNHGGNRLVCIYYNIYCLTIVYIHIYVYKSCKS